MTHFGWDASDYDWSRGPMDLDAAVRDGIEFFTHKATEGTTIRHVHYGEALDRARASKLAAYGAYMVVRTPGNGGAGTIAQQVAYFVAYLDAATPWWRTDPRFCILQVDTEHWGYDNVDPTYGAQAAALLVPYGRWRVHYAPRWSYGDTIPGTEPLWASAYGTNPAVPYRQAYPGAAHWPDPYSGRTPAVWQYGSRLTIGSQPQCDANAIEDEQVWQDLLGGDMDAWQDVELFNAWKVLEALRAGSATVPQNTGVDATGKIEQFDLFPVKAIKALAAQVDALTQAVAALGVPTVSNAQITALAAAVADKLIASRTNSLTAADHAAVVADVKTALAAAAQAQAAALTAS